MVVVPCQTIIALIIASVLSSRIRGKTFFRAVYFLPTLTSSSALTIIFMFMFSVTGYQHHPHQHGHPSRGRRHQLPEQPRRCAPGHHDHEHLVHRAAVHHHVPRQPQDLPASLYEAADIDGAGTFEKFKSITIPYLKPITTYVLLTGIIGTLQMFDRAYIFSNGSGGPANSTLTVSLMVYRYGTTNAMGYKLTTIAIVSPSSSCTVSLIAEAERCREVVLRRREHEVKRKPGA